jgi:hypothetical protein
MAEGGDRPGVETISPTTRVPRSRSLSPSRTSTGAPRWGRYIVVERIGGRLSLARALWEGGGDRGRARTLAEAAAAGPQPTEARDWLAARR